MPAVIVAAGASALAAQATSVVFLQAIIAGAITMVVNQALGLTPRPRTPSFSSQARERQVMLRSAVEPRRIIYGEAVASGPIVFAHVTREYGIAQGDRTFVVPQTGFTVTVDGNYHSTVAVYVLDPSASTEAMDAWVPLTEVASAPSPSQYSVSGGTYTFNSALAGRTVRVVYRYTTSEVRNSFLHLVIPLAAHECEEIGDVYLGQDVIRAEDLDSAGNVVAGKYAHYVRIKKHLGAPGQVADADLIAESEGRWTASRVGANTAYIYVRLRRNADLFPNGVPNIRAKVKGAKLYDPRTGQTAWSNNWALVVYDYLRHAEGLGCDADENNEDLVIAAANVSDEDVEIDDQGTTQKRYTADGVVSTGDRPFDILRALLTAGAGAAIYSGSTWDVYAGAYHAPTFDLTVSDLRGPIEGQADIERRDVFNGVRGTFIDPERDYQPTSFPPVTNPAYVAEDNDEEIYRDIELPFTQNAIRAQRIAKIFLERARQATTVAWPGKPRLFRRNTWEVANVYMPQLGWNPKPMRIVSWSWQPGGAVDYVLREDSPAIYDWNHGEATVLDPAPNTTLPNAGVVAPPGAPAVAEALVASNDSRSVEVKVTLTCEPSPDVYVTAYQFEYKPAAAEEWTVLPLMPVPAAEIRGLEAGVYDWRVKGITALGRQSIYAQTRKEIIGLGAEPGDVTILGLQAAGNLAILTIAPTEDLDVEKGGRVLVRHIEATANQSWEESFSIGQELGYPGSSTVIVLPLKAGSYGVRFEDAGGRRSPNPAWIVAKQASVLAYSPLDELQEDDTFPGSHDGTVAVDGVLKLAGLGSFDDIEDLDEIPSLDNFGGVRTTGTYTFAAGFDFGSVKNVRLTGVIEGQTINVNDTIDARTANIDTWLSFDGDQGGGSADAWIEFRETDDDPGGSPAWSEWKRLDASEVQCRGAQFRLQIRSYDDAYNLHVSALRVKAEEVS